METEQRIDRMEEVVADTRQRLVRIEVQLAGVEARMSTKEDIAILRTELAHMELRMLKWFIGTAITLTAAASTIVFAIAKLIH
ncbi:hypothetical protein [Duganella guangzhouensis]|nr:hypothetical protein [Duganella guangzhouensis]